MVVGERQNNAVLIASPAPRMGLQQQLVGDGRGARAPPSVGGWVGLG